MGYENDVIEYVYDPRPGAVHRIEPGQTVYLYTTDEQTGEVALIGQSAVGSVERPGPLYELVKVAVPDGMTEFPTAVRIA